MIPQIQQINFPSYASLTNAVATFADMGERTISTQIKIDGDVVPDFDGWELSFKGERFVLPVKEPQAAKDNTSRRSMVDLVFYSWPIDELKRYFFVEMASIASGTAIADKYKASLGLSLENFVTAFNNVLDYYFNGRIVMSLFGSGTGIYSNEPAYVEIDYTKIWDVLQKVYEVYEVRWNIEYDSINDIYTIKVGYPSPEIDDHEFEYGYEGGLLRFERQVQDYDLTNILLGRGGEKNLPYRYFKEVDPNNPSWAGDPDAIPELANIYFENLRDINFRRYVQGWKTNSNRILEEGQTVDTYDSERGQTDFAYAKGHTDETFNPVEYVKDDDSIAIYGERWGALDNAEDIYPTIQGIEISPYGRIDQVVDVEDVVTDDIEAMAADAAEITNVVGAERSEWINYNSTIEVVINGADFSVPAGKVGNLTFVNTWFDTIQYAKQGNHQVSVSDSDPVHELVGINTTLSYMKVVDKSTSLEIAPSGIPAGNYYYKLYITVKAEFEQSMYTAVNVTVGVDGLKLTTSDSNANAWKPTFDIWVKNIWNTTQGGSESDTAYAARVWEPILGDRTGNEAKISFSTGLLSISEDYNFTIASIPVVDRTKTINGVTSEWRITLIKSDAEYQATGKYIPNADTGGNASAGDYFFFTGIDMPHAYVLWAEEKLNAYKTTELGKLKQINPTWVIKIDKVRANTLLTGETVALADRLTCGAKIDISDSRFTNGNTLTLYAQTITYTWQEPSSGNPYIVPDIEVVLSDKVETVTSPIDKLEGSVDLIQSSYARISDIESIVRKVANPLYLKKTGESEKSLSPTRFSSIIASEEFRQGDFGGQGWGAYIDGDGHSVYEADVLVARKGMRVNTLVINQVAYLGGKQIISAAAIECTKVEVDGNGDYVCYFDQKQGSVANNFVVNDIVLGQVWNADDTQQRYYKRKVTAVTSDSITLSATIADGTDAPQVGDVMVQFGNYTQSARQYVIVRDVIGGGYERMLSGLSTVYSTGDEYYFAGRQSGSTERWFVGNSSGQYAQYQNGVLTIAGRLAVTTQIDTGNGNYEALSSYLSNLQDQIDGNVQTWYASGVPTLQNYPASTWPTVEDKNNHIGDLYYDSATGKAYRFMYDGTEEVYLWTQIADEDIAAALALAQQNATDISGLQYLKTATNNGTLIQGGLVLTSLIQLGQIESSVYKVYSGINGIMDGTAQGSGIAAWYGGEMLEKSVWDTYNSTQQAAHRYAKSLFRFDGSGYLASENIKWDANGNGQIPGISWNNGTITLSSSIYLEGGDRLTEVVDAVNRMYTQFAYDSHDNIVVKPTEALYIPDHAPLYPLAGSNALYVDYNGNYPVTPGSSVTTVGRLYIKNGGVTAGPWDLKTGDQTADISTLFNGYALQSWVSSNFNNYELPVAASNVLGGVKVGTGLSIDANGVLTATYAYSLPIASSSTLGGIKVGSGLSINESTGVLSATYSYTLPTASADTKGGVKIGTGLSMSGEVLSLSSETQTSLGKADTAYQKPSGGIPDSDLADAYLKLSGNSVATKITGDVYMTRGKYLKMVESNGTDSVNLLGISSSGAWFTLGNSSYRAEINSNNSNILHVKNGVSYAVYDESNLTKSVLTTLLESSNGYYVKKAGDTMTGNLTFDASSAAKSIYYKISASSSLSAVYMATNGDLAIGYDNAANSKTTNVDGYKISLRFGGSKQYSMNLDNGGTVQLTGMSAFRPTQANTVYLGTATYRWSGMYSKGANLDTFLAIPQSAPSTSASWYSANDAYLYADTSGNYSESAEGGVANVYPLTITINGTSTVYNPGSAAQTVSFGVPTSAQISAWNAKYDKPSGGIPGTDLATAYLPLAGNAVASKITGNVVLGNNVFLQGVHTNGTDVRELIGLDNNNIVTVGCSTNQLRLLTSSVDIKHNKNGTLYSVYDESNLSLATLAGSSAIGSTSKPVYYNGSSLVACGTSLTDYLPLSGGTITSTGVKPLILNSTHSSSQSTLRLSVSGTEKAIFGYQEAYNVGAYLQNLAVTNYPYVNIASDGKFKYNNSWVFWHEGNDGTSSGLDADLLDGNHGSYYDSLYAFYDSGSTSANGVQYPLALLNTDTPNSSYWWYIRSMYYSSTSQCFQEAFTYNQTIPDMYIRQRYGGTATSWYKLYHTGNLAKSDLTALLDASTGTYVPKKDGVRFYPYIGTNSSASFGAQWFKVTLSHNGQAAGANRWYMLSMDLVINSAYSTTSPQSAIKGTVHLQYYFTYNNSAGTYAAGIVKGVFTGMNYPSLQIKYDPANPAIFYVKTNGGTNIYNTLSIENLMANDSAANIDYSTTTIVGIAEADIPSTATSEVPIDSYLPLTAGSSYPLTGHLYFNTSDTHRQIVWTYGTNQASSGIAVFMATTGHLYLGYNQISKSKYTYLDGANIYLNWNTDAALRRMVFQGNIVYPNVNATISLGTTDYRWASVHAASANLYDYLKLDNANPRIVFANGSTSYGNLAMTGVATLQMYDPSASAYRTIIHDNNTTLIHSVNDATTYNPSTSSFQSGRTAWAAAIDSHALGVGSRTGYKEDGTNYLSGAIVLGQAITVNGSTVYGGVISPAGSVTFTYSGTSYTVNNPSSSHYRTFVVVKGTNMITPNTSSWSASSGRGWWVWANGFYYVASGCGAFLQCGDAYCVVSADNVSSTTATAAQWTKNQVYVRVPINSSSSYQDGMYAFAEGIYSVANTRAGVAMGYSAFSTGLSSTAIGTYPMALSNYSVAIGYLAVASGTGSTVLGYQSWASGNYSTAIGLSTVAATSYQTVIGKYNLWNSSDAFQIGWGGGDNDRKNILTLGQTGNLWLAEGGSILVGQQTNSGTSISNYISAGRGSSVNSGRYGLKILSCDQGDFQGGLGTDLASSSRSGWGSGWNMCVATTHWTGANTAHLSFVTHQVNSTSYSYLGGFQYTPNSGLVEFTVNGKSYLPQVEVDTSLAVPTAAPSSPTSGKVYMWIGSTGTYVN